MDMQKRIWTIGHSTRDIETFCTLLREHEIQLVADVRRYPASRKYPQYHKQELSSLLAGKRIDYIHFPELGGRRNPGKNSLNSAWRNSSFRGYADYMETEPFVAAVNLLIAEGLQRRVAFMCSEAVWWSCHRSLVADYLKADGWLVIHILSERKTQEHPYTKPARLEDGKLTYRGIL